MKKVKENWKSVSFWVQIWPTYHTLRIVWFFLEDQTQSVLLNYYSLPSGIISQKRNGKILRKVKKCWFWAQKMSHLPYHDNMNFTLKSKTILGQLRSFLKKKWAPSFLCLLNPNFMQKSEQSNDTILIKPCSRQKKGWSGMWCWHWWLIYEK